MSNAHDQHTISEVRYHTTRGYFFAYSQGRQIYLGKDAKLAELRRQELIAESIARQREALNRPPIDSNTQNILLLDEAIGAFLAHFTKGNYDRSDTALCQRSMGLLSNFCGSKIIHNFKTQDYLDFRAHLMSITDHRGKKFSRNYLNKLTKMVKRLFKYCAQNDHCTVEQYNKLALIQNLEYGKGGIELNARQGVPDSTVEACLPFMQPMIADMVRLQMLSGMRPCELSILTHAQISRPGHIVIIPRTNRPLTPVTHDQTTVWFYLPVVHKNTARSKPKVICFGPRCQTILAPYLANPTSEYIFDGRLLKSRRSTQRRLPYTSVELYRDEIHRAVQRHNKAHPDSPLEDWTPYQLRHAAAQAYSEAYGRDTAAAVLGHDGLDTISVYVTQELIKASKAAAELG